MKLHIHRLGADGQPECLEQAELVRGRQASISFDPEDVKEPWTITVHRDEGDELEGDVVVLTLGTSKQIEEHGRAIVATERETLVDGLDGEVIPEVGGNQ